MDGGIGEEGGDNDGGQLGGGDSKLGLVNMILEGLD